jgi:hypothetical protein
MALKSIKNRKLGIEDLKPMISKKYTKNSGNLEEEKNEVRRDRV